MLLNIITFLGVTKQKAKLQNRRILFQCVLRLFATLLGNRGLVERTYI
jgi:hypothetical protein